MLVGGKVSPAKFFRLKGGLFILFAVVFGLVFAGCGSETAPVAVQAATATVAPTVTPTIGSTPTPTLVPLDVANRPYYEALTDNQVVQARQEWFRLIDQNEQKWKAKNIASYQVEMTYHNTPWPPGEHYAVTVRNNAVAEVAYSLVKCMSCSEDVPPTPDPAKRTYKDARGLTVPGLFELARTSVYGYVNVASAFKITFDPAYGFPKRMTTESIRYTDLGKYWDVMGFKELS
ncbi:MAG: hypothetical protein J0I20_21060 [Chloroflexi bacterium]|nr:hypothetical protein [Chloroflexota bacterium]OJV96551.1 MAG: hypothetical protein BGO39_09850 [Chloroflexi bacterium 54-19]